MKNAQKGNSTLLMFAAILWLIGVIHVISDKAFSTKHLVAALVIPPYAIYLGGHGIADFFIDRGKK